MSVSLPTNPEGATKWMDVFKRMNDLNIVPLIACAIMGYYLYSSRAEGKAELAAAEQRTRAALVECKAEAAAQAVKTRDTVRSEAASQGSQTREAVRDTAAATKPVVP